MRISQVGGGAMVRPNVSHCVEENEVHYNPVDLIFNDMNMLTLVCQVAHCGLKTHYQ